MNILLRIVAVFVLLGSLAYGSYAVGRYVLSEKLFGNSVAVKPSSGLVESSTPRVTSRSKVSTTGKPPIQVRVLSADQAEAGPEVNSIKDLQPSATARSTFTPTEKPKIVNANTLGKSRSQIKLRNSAGKSILGQSGVQQDDDNRVSRRSRRTRTPEERPRRRRKRRTRRSTTTVVAEPARTRSSRSSDSSSDSRPTRRSSSSDSGSSRSSRSSSSSSSTVPARSQGNSSGDSGNGPF